MPIDESKIGRKLIPHTGCTIDGGLDVGTTGNGNVFIIYRPKTKEEKERRVARAKAAVGPFLPVPLPGYEDKSKIAFVSTEGHKIRVSDVEMVYNDMLLMDEISDHGRDGPLYRSICTPVWLEVLDWAIQAYGKRAMQ